MTPHDDSLIPLAPGVTVSPSEVRWAWFLGAPAEYAWLEPCDYPRRRRIGADGYPVRPADYWEEKARILQEAFLSRFPGKVARKR